MSRHQLKPQPTAAERMERKRKAKEQREQDKQQRQEVKQTLKLATLGFDYSTLDEGQRDLVQRMALVIRVRLKRTVEDMIVIGGHLNLVKEMLPDRFEEWIKAEFDMSRATASEYRNMADRFTAHVQLLYMLSATIVRRLAAPGVPDEAVAAVIKAAKKSTKPLRVQDAMAIVKPFLPVKPPRLVKPKQLTGPVAEPDPAYSIVAAGGPLGAPFGEKPTITAEYTVAPAPPTFAEWLAAMPAGAPGALSLGECMAVCDMAKKTALRARELRPDTLLYATADVVKALSTLIYRIEQELKP